jgi:hypothetical protein
LFRVGDGVRRRAHFEQACGTKPGERAGGQWRAALRTFFRDDFRPGNSGRLPDGWRRRWWILAPAFEQHHDDGNDSAKQHEPDGHDHQDNQDFPATDERAEHGFKCNLHFTRFRSKTGNMLPE